jgi:hypothetical protein
MDVPRAMNKERLNRIHATSSYVPGMVTMGERLAHQKNDVDRIVLTYVLLLFYITGLRSCALGVRRASKSKRKQNSAHVCCCGFASQGYGWMVRMGERHAHQKNDVDRKVLTYVLLLFYITGLRMVTMGE